MKITEVDLKWVHMAQYELMCRLDGALWLMIISKTPFQPRNAKEGPKLQIVPRRGQFQNQILLWKFEKWDSDIFAKISSFQNFVFHPFRMSSY